MGLFTDIAAALSYNFGDSSKLSDEYYDHVFELDRTEEERKLLDFLKHNNGGRCQLVEDSINTINKYTKNYNRIPYDKIMQDTGYSRERIDEAVDAMKKYNEQQLKENENIDYAVNNITQSSNKNSERTDILANMLTVVAQIMASDADFMYKVNDIADSLDSSQSDEECVGKQLILDLVNDHPETYDQLRSIIQSSPDVEKPFAVNPDQDQQTHREMNEIAMEQILDPNKNAGISPEIIEAAKQQMMQNQKQDQDTETEQQQTAEGDGFTMTDPEPQEEDKDKKK